MREYLDLEHKENISSALNMSYYIPQDYVLKPQSCSTKLPVVFNASVNPKLQEDIVSILLNFRLFKELFRDSQLMTYAN